MNESVIQTIAVYAVPVLFAITLHEVAHGWTARYFGDRTAELAGRLSLNPLKHVDPLGTIAMPLALYFMTSGAFVFGFAKPVPVNIHNLRQAKRNMLWVAFAGPCANLAMALLWMLFAIVLMGAGVQEPFFMRAAEAGVAVNFVMAALNLFPLPPLDGGRMLASLLPLAQTNALLRFEPYGFIVVLVLAATHVLDYWMHPILNVMRVSLNWLMSPLVFLFS